MTAQRQLIVMRHAKAGELPGGPDFERALRPRGCRNASDAGRWLAGQALVPDLVLCSKARRARQTWQYVSAELAGEPEVVHDPRLYEAGAADLLGILAEAGRQARSVMYVGHNPAAASLAEILLARPVGFPTAAIVVIALELSWHELADGSGAGAGAGAGKLIASWTPHGEDS